MMAQGLNFADNGQRRQRIPHRRAHLLQILAARAGRWLSSTWASPGGLATGTRMISPRSSPRRSAWLSNLLR